MSLTNAPCNTTCIFSTHRLMAIELIWTRMSTVVQQSFEPRLHWPTAERNGRTSKYGNRDDTISEPVQLNGGRLCLGFCLPTNAVKAGRNGLVELKRFKNRLSPPLYLSIHGWVGSIFCSAPAVECSILFYWPPL